MGRHRAERNSRRREAPHPGKRRGFRMVTAPTARSVRWSNWFAEHAVVFSFAGLLGLGIAMTCVSDRFLTWENLSNIGRQVSINAIIATGMTLVIITGGIDLSVGAVMTLAMTLGAGAMLAGGAVALAGVVLVFLGEGSGGGGGARVFSF